MTQATSAFPLTRKALLNALGYHPDLTDGNFPGVSFELGIGLKRLGAIDIPLDEQVAVELQIFDCYQWCARRYPLVIRDVAGSRCCAIQSIRVGRSGHPGEYLTASSPQDPYTILVAAPWPVPSRYRLASLFAHEAMHQALYNRERGGSVARFGSLAYSPWKSQLRPGRLVWHAFWTFSCQFIFLAEAVADSTEGILAEDPGILDFLAEMEARLECCAESAATFEILASREAHRTLSTLRMVRQMGHILASDSRYFQHRDRWNTAVQNEVDLWSSVQVSVPKGADQRKLAPATASS